MGEVRPAVLGGILIPPGRCSPHVFAKKAINPERVWRELFRWWGWVLHVWSTDINSETVTQLLYKLEFFRLRSDLSCVLG